MCVYVYGGDQRTVYGSSSLTPPCRLQVVRLRGNHFLAEPSPLAPDICKIPKFSSNKSSIKVNFSRKQNYMKKEVYIVNVRKVF